MTETEVCEQLQGVFAELTDQLNVPNLSGAYIAGGAIASLILGEVPKDYDVWFKTPHDFLLAADLAMRAVTVGKLKLIAETKFSITLRLNSDKVVQLVQSRIGEPSDVVGTFDFLHTHAYYDPSSKFLACYPKFIASKRLEYVPGNLKHPVNTFQRMLKFAARGYTVPTSTIAALLSDVHALGDEELAAIAEETGVRKDGRGDCY